MEMNKDVLTIRPPQADDVNFIMATWLRGVYYGCKWFGQMPKDLFMQGYHSLLIRLLSTAGIQVRVACLKDDPTVIIGYSVTGGQDSQLHWVFVKTGWRKLGVARSLVPDTVKSVSHLTKIGSAILKAHPAVVFNPLTAL